MSTPLLTILWRLKKVNVLLITISLLIVSDIFSQEVSTTAQREFSFKNISKGSVILRIHDIVQDDAGFVWFGTLSGIYRYDGLNFKPYRANPADPNSLADNDVRNFMIDSNGVLWIASFSNLSRYNRYTDTFEIVADDTESGLWSNSVLELVETGDGTIWIATTEGLNFLKDGNIGRFTNLPNERIWALSSDNSDRIWAATNNEIYIIDQNQPVTKLSALSTKTIRDSFCMINASDGTTWIGTSGQGLYHLEENGLEKIEVTNFKHNSSNPSAIGSNNILDLHEDSFGRIWVGTENGGLNLFQPETNDFLRFVDDPTNSGSISVIQSGIFMKIRMDDFGWALTTRASTCMILWGKNSITFFKMRPIAMDLQITQLLPSNLLRMTKFGLAQMVEALISGTKTVAVLNIFDLTRKTSQAWEVMLF